MAAQRKTNGPELAEKDREFEELLRRAALYSKSQTPASHAERQPAALKVVRRKRVKAA
jgi:hypothetical protein